MKRKKKKCERGEQTAKAKRKRSKTPKKSKKLENKGLFDVFKLRKASVKLGGRG